MATKQSIYILSDSVGETAQSVVSAVTAQFPSLVPFDLNLYPFVDNLALLKDILREALQNNGIVVYTLVNQELIQYTTDFCTRSSLLFVDVMAPLIHVLHATTGMNPSEEIGALHQLNDDYFDRIAAIEFAVRYDDGKDPRGFLKADYVILGVSRTSKTPLSMLLANKTFKVANLPLIPGVPLPKELSQVPKERLIGLTTDLEQLMTIRKSRLRSMGLNEDTAYSDMQHIAEELEYAYTIYDTYGIKPINIKDKAIEETATLIIGDQI
ncbi:pyruvate, water dikinase regulatory protein [Carnobacterium gallinarum]|uniref:pyruvate, water dikinase regulatory protein n=1 Tax=Carnobacterium gallinarum TaxID=2749 RepID=UPI0005581171|nr:pyruvate, water dikinase regulatory protein [Carnobacterium gallinarum]